MQGQWSPVPHRCSAASPSQPGFQQLISLAFGNLFGPCRDLGVSFARNGNPGMVGGPRAGGGPMVANTPYLAGENGPELVLPNRSSYVVPNGAMGGGGVKVQAIDHRSIAPPHGAAAGASRLA